MSMESGMDLKDKIVLHCSSEVKCKGGKGT